MIKLTTLIENTADADARLHAEHGLSMLIEDGDFRILYDTGQSGNFVRNAKALGLDLEKTDCMVVSHAHYDHAGGMKTFLAEYRTRPPLFISRKFFSQGPKYHFSDGSVQTDFSKEPGRRYIGVDFTEDELLAEGVPIRYVENDMTPLSARVRIFTNFKRSYAFERFNPTMELKTSAGYAVDPFSDEIALAAETGDGLVVLLGCGHPGFLNMASSIAARTGKKIRGIIGGTHLVEADEDRIDRSIAAVKELGVEYLGLSHCTGDAALKKFRAAFPNSFVNCTGSIIHL